MEFNGYTDQQMQTLRVLLETTEVKGVENCKNIVMIKQIIDQGKRIKVDEEVQDGEKK